MSYQHLYKRFLQGHSGYQHFCAHSHHFWPDVTREAVLEYWDDAAKHSDKKWGKIFGEKVPQAQQHIARTLGLSHPENIVFAPNTHELIYRFFSAFYEKKSVRVLTTDSEFYSFSRQLNRWLEAEMFQVEIVSQFPLENFEERFCEKANKENYDIIFLSQVFFNTGVATHLDKILPHLPKEAQIIVDGYHSFMALPTDLSAYEDRIYFTAGSYKYAQAGEGCCFLTLPTQCDLKPVNTGWFAEIKQLGGSRDHHQTFYPTDGMRFAGSTMDMSALYKLIACYEAFEKEGITVRDIHSHVQKQQESFLEELEQIQHPQLSRKNVITRDLSHHGHFLTFELDSPQETEKLQKKLEQEMILTDHRENRLRFGFGMYHDGNFDLSSLC